MPSDTEQVSYIVYKGEMCKWLSQAVVFGKVYYDIIYKGVKKTVPASECKKSL